MESFVAPRNNVSPISLVICVIDEDDLWCSHTHEHRCNIGTPRKAKDLTRFFIKSDGRWGVGKSLQDQSIDFKSVIQNRGWLRTALPPGRHHSRIWRGGRSFTTKGDHRYYPCPLVEDLEVFETFLEAIFRLEALLNDLETAFRTTPPISQNLTAWGKATRELLMSAATEVEAQWKGVLTANNSGPRAANYTTQDYIRLLGPMKLDQYQLSLRRFPKHVYCPFQHWSDSAPTKSLQWYDAYNKTKHDAANHQNEATLSRVIEAVAACVVMLAAQYGEESLSRFECRNHLFQFEQTPVWPESDWYVHNPKSRSWNHVDAQL